jgi:hypothetical protein
LLDPEQIDPTALLTHLIGSVEQRLRAEDMELT